MASFPRLLTVRIRKALTELRTSTLLPALHEITLDQFARAIVRQLSILCTLIGLRKRLASRPRFHEQPVPGDRQADHRSPVTSAAFPIYPKVQTPPRLAARTEDLFRVIKQTPRVEFAAQTRRAEVFHGRAR